MSTETFTREALSQLDALRNFAFKLCRNEQHTNDLVQETMLKACRAFHTYREGTNCRAWLFQICKNSYINEFRRHRYETVPVDLNDERNADRDDNAIRFNRGSLTDNYAGRVHNSTFGDEVMSALEQLPPDYQTAIILCDVEGLSYEEIAEFTRTPIGTIRSRIHRGRKMLAVHLEEYARQLGYRSEFPVAA